MTEPTLGTEGGASKGKNLGATRSGGRLPQVGYPAGQRTRSAVEVQVRRGGATSTRPRGLGGHPGVPGETSDRPRSRRGEGRTPSADRNHCGRRPINHLGGYGWASGMDCAETRAHSSTRPPVPGPGPLPTLSGGRCANARCPISTYRSLLGKHLGGGIMAGPLHEYGGALRCPASFAGVRIP